MFSRIIVAFDGSDRANDALALALRLRDAVPADAEREHLHVGAEA
jgi:nucleotide-binding universal stress UspA family protein